MEAGIKVNVEDAEGNTTLHVKSYGETGNLSELDAIDMLVANGADLTIRNNRVCDRADGAATTIRAPSLPSRSKPIFLHTFTAQLRIFCQAPLRMVK